VKREKRGAALNARRKVFGFIQATKRDATQRLLSEELDKTQSVLEQIRDNRDKRQVKLPQSEKKRQRMSSSRQSEPSGIVEVPSSPFIPPDSQRVSVCFICKETLHGDLDVINQHIDACLSRSEGDTPMPTQNSSAETTPRREARPVEQDQGDGYEVYTWGNETRIRVSTMLQGGYAGAGFSTTKHSKNTDVEGDLEIDGDESAVYGAPQYTERDLVAPPGDEEGPTIRERMLGDETLPPPRPPTSAPSSVPPAAPTPTPTTSTDPTLNTQPPAPEGKEEDAAAEADGDRRNGGSSALLIASLKERIREQERATQASFKCLVCMDPYLNPLVSVQCWHVHCEACWLQTLGAKKLCPQCNIITSPSELRKIYL